MKKVKKRSAKKGMPPGTLVHVGGKAAGNTTVRLFTYDPVSFTEETLTDLDLYVDQPEGARRWLDMDGLDTERILHQIGQRFDLHPLLLEDVLNTDHRPKVEEYQETLFVVAKMLRLDPETEVIQVEQICFVLRQDIVISFQEHPGDVLDPVRERIRLGTGRLRRAGADYLLYALLDVIVDNYFLIVERLGERIEQLERKVMLKPGNVDLFTIQELRSQLIAVSRHITPMRELAGRLNILPSDLIDRSTRRYMNDLQDHTVYIAETIATFREMLANLENSYHAMVNLRSGQVIKLLTIISTIFIPLTFIVGIYGMNFDHMPWLHSPFGFYGVVGFMLALCLGMLFWFRHKRWL
ncbi:MAG: magnesium/cobalt transporter CorA [Flavobacteriales bacterium]|nr:magnesium/cobalt transporter CorA [Flavobacteriales bacterium]